MDWKKEWKPLAVFLACFYLPVGIPLFAMSCNV